MRGRFIAQSIMLEGKRILLVITGSIAAYKSLLLIRLLTKAGASVEAVLTKGGAQFVTPLSVETLTGQKAYCEMWEENAYEMNHIELSRRADLIVVAPASADFIGKMAQGLGDDLASSVMLARDKPLLIAPSMNVEMWENASFLRNLEKLQGDGATLIPPQTDVLACGEEGIGKMAEPETIFAAIERRFARGELLASKSAVVTSGGTIERIDSVRYLSNFSSGKQGNAIALAIAEAGAQVKLVLGNAKEAAPAHPRIDVIPVESALQMKDVVHESLPCDLFIGCAAVCDFRVANAASGKIKKGDGLKLEFEENPDVAQSVGMLPEGQRPALVIGFAAETEKLIEHARAKLAAKGCDLILANDVSGGAVFGEDENTVTFVTKDGEEALPSMSKSAVADKLVDWVAERMG